MDVDYLVILHTLVSNSKCVEKETVLTQPANEIAEQIAKNLKNDNLRLKVKLLNTK